VFQRGGALPSYDREGGESPTGGGAQICGAVEETVRLQIIHLFTISLIVICLYLSLDKTLIHLYTFTFT